MSIEILFISAAPPHPLSAWLSVRLYTELVYMYIEILKWEPKNGFHPLVNILFQSYKSLYPHAAQKQIVYKEGRQSQALYC